MRQQRERAERDDARGADDLVGGGGGGRGGGALGDHLARGGRVAVVDAEEVDVHHPLDVRLGELEERLDLGDAGVGDHGVERAEGGDGGVHHGGDGGGGGHVAEVGHGFAAEGLDLGDDLEDGEGGLVERGWWKRYQVVSWGRADN